jgi:Fusaric acid resistance protein family
MADAIGQGERAPDRSAAARWVAASANAARAAGPPLLFGLRLWASVCLALYVAFWLELDNAYWAGTSAAIVCQPHLGASLLKGWFQRIGTIIGAIAIMVLTACLPALAARRVRYLPLSTPKRGGGLRRRGPKQPSYRKRHRHCPRAPAPVSD